MSAEAEAAMLIPAGANEGWMHVHPRVTEPDLGRPSGTGWRIEVDLTRERWRWTRRYGHKREATPYRPLAELPPDRIERARRESDRQRRLKRQ